jgi:ABC-2 type transport system ATP-binding protein
MYENSNENTTNAGIRAEGLGKRFGDFTALEDLDLVVPQGSVLGLLGHNGAGKTTTIRILTTLSAPTTGSATVAGFDVASQGAEVRKRIGVAGQSATVDGLLTGRANLEMVGRLYGMSKKKAAERADELLDRVNLTEVAEKLVKEYSGGMRRRVDLAATLVAAPPVLFLDEPTTGLDPQSRNDLWGILREQVNQGSTLLLTTQYLDEADRLADEIVVLDHGKVAAAGSPAELKQRIGGDRIEVTLDSAADAGPAAEALAGFAEKEVFSDPDGQIVTAPVRSGTRLVEVVRALDAAGIDASDVHRRDATLDDVFLSLTNTEKKAEVA